MSCEKNLYVLAPSFLFSIALICAVIKIHSNKYLLVDMKQYGRLPKNLFRLKKNFHLNHYANENGIQIDFEVKRYSTPS